MAKVLQFGGVPPKVTLLTNARVKSKVVPFAADRGNAAWWLSVLKWVDADDLDTGAAHAFLMDLLVSRPTEFSVFLNLFAKAFMRSTTRETLTVRQELALDYAEEAVRLKLNAARYVAGRMGIAAVSAYQLLKRARENEAKIHNSASNPYTTNRGSIHLPSEADIQRKMAERRCKCPGHGANEECESWTRGDRELCFSCYRKYGFEGERPAWLEFLTADLRRENREWAIDELSVTFVADDDGWEALEWAA